MVPVTVFEVDGVLLSGEIDASDDLELLHEFFPGRLIEPLLVRSLAVPAAACEPAAAREAAPWLGRHALLDPTIVSHALAAFALRGGQEWSRDTPGKKKGERPIASDREKL